MQNCLITIMNSKKADISIMENKKDKNKTQLCSGYFFLKGGG